MGCSECSVKIKSSNNLSNGVCQKCGLKITAYNRYFDANIPLEYWNLSMEKDFKGAKNLLEAYQYLVEDLNRTYNDGKNVIFAGLHGVGKTMTVCNVLKKSCHKNYNCLYTTLSDMVGCIVEAPYEEKFNAKLEMQQTDFFVIDEFDNRHISNGGADLFGRSLENILRARIQNALPTIMCSNSPNPLETFNGSIKEALSSLMNRIKVFPIVAKDFRKEQGITK